MRVQSKFIQLMEGKAHYLECGEGENLIFLHGWLQDASAYTPLYKKLGKNFRILAPDFYGCGLSSNPPSGANTDTLCDFVFDFAQNLNVEKFYLCGISMGAVIALKTLEKDKSGKIDKAVIIDGGVFLSKDLLNNKLLFTIKGIYEGWKTYLFSLKVFPAFFIFRSIFMNSIFHLKAQKEILKKADEQEFIKIRENLKNIKVKVLLLWGEKDSLFPLEQTQFLKSEITDSQLSVIPKVDHSWPLVKQKVAVSQITEFLNQ